MVIPRNRARIRRPVPTNDRTVPASPSPNEKGYRGSHRAWPRPTRFLLEFQHFDAFLGQESSSAGSFPANPAVFPGQAATEPAPSVVGLDFDSLAVVGLGQLGSAGPHSHMAPRTPEPPTLGTIFRQNRLRSPWRWYPSRSVNRLTSSSSITSRQTALASVSSRFSASVRNGPIRKASPNPGSQFESPAKVDARPEPGDVRDVSGPSRVA